MYPSKIHLLRAWSLKDVRRWREVVPVPSTLWLPVWMRDLSLSPTGMCSHCDALHHKGYRSEDSCQLMLCYLNFHSPNCKWKKPLFFICTCIRYFVIISENGLMHKSLCSGHCSSQGDLQRSCRQKPCTNGAHFTPHLCVCLSVSVFWKGISLCSSSWSWTLYVVRVDLKLMLILPWLLKY